MIHVDHTLFTFTLHTDKDVGNAGEHEVSTRQDISFMTTGIGGR